MKKLALFLTLLVGFSCEMRNPNVLPKEFKERNYQEVRFSEKSSSMFDYTGKFAMYPNGNEGLFADIQENLVYPDVEIDNGTEGEVIIQFVVSEMGKAKDISIVKGINENFNSAAIKAIESLQEWYPANNHGRPIFITYELPIRFELPEEYKKSDLKKI